MRSFSLSQKREGYDPNNRQIYEGLNKYRLLVDETLIIGTPRKIDGSLHIGKERGDHVKNNFYRTLNQALANYGGGKSGKLKEGETMTLAQKRIIEKALKEAEAYNNAIHKRYT